MAEIKCIERPKTSGSKWNIEINKMLNRYWQEGI